MTGTTQTSSQTYQSKFDTYGVSTDIDDHCSVTMLNSEQDFVGPLKNDDALSTDLRVERYTQFMRAPPLG